MCDCMENPMVRGSVTKPKARKVHRCGECLRDILPGERYEYVSGIWKDSGGSTHKTCADCVRLREVIGIECYAYGLMMDAIDYRDGGEGEAFAKRRRENWERRRVVQ
ncbi:hypothetical protein TBK1r_60650 [Stieleria magnilauensis]|uniref:Uncharacterized protein n=2 Tax=Stieleria magnilauensis TaxID=2527963 RepID=A0ABX5XZT1_9BACT|nr:hypothetical protein TBK1r_59870 [Planctomycetes bacterium TBK1r]QDV87038.1 hypothetical protein TBK1r_60650 [Planctomycetes bacterium TBK1r]